MIPELAHEKLTEAIIGAAIKVHRALGPGLLESAYETCLVHELSKSNMSIMRQVEVPVVYDSITLDAGFRLDLLIDNTVIVELKSIDKLAPIHEAQLMTYLRLSRKPVGLLINFNVTRLIDGVLRRVMTQPPLRHIDSSA
jgi:GxxExxY protein